MKQQIFAKGKRLITGTDPAYMLKGDGVNDMVLSLTGNDFYNLGFGPFAFFYSWVPFGDIVSGAIRVTAGLFSKRTKANASDFSGYSYGISTPANGAHRLFGLVRTGTANGPQFRIATANNINEFHSAIKVGQLNRLAFFRNTQTQADLRDMSKYTCVLNGKKFPMFLEVDTASGDHTNSETFALFENSISQHRAYLQGFQFYSGIVTQAQIDDFMLTGRYPNENGRLFYNAQHKSGNKMQDGSSVKNDGTLINYTDTEMGIPNPATNRVWCCPAAYFETNGTKAFKAHRDLTITKIARGFSSVLQATAVHRRAGVELGNYVLNFPSNHITEGLAIEMKEGDFLEFTVSNLVNLADRGMIELFYN